MLTLDEKPSANPRFKHGKMSRVSLVAHNKAGEVISDVLNGREIWEFLHPVVKPVKTTTAKASKPAVVSGADLASMF